MSGSTRTVVLVEGSLGVLESKTACCVIRYRPDNVVALLDSEHAGMDASEIIGIGEGIPVVASIEEAEALSPTELLIGIAPRGGALPEEWRAIILSAVERRLDIVSGLHDYLSDDPQISLLAKEKGVRIRDIRRPRPSVTVGTGKARDVEATVILTVGTDCNVGKMTVSFELYRAARKAGIRTALATTGQTGVYILGDGAVVDSVKADFVSGSAEELVLRVSEGKELVIVEGQGSLLHPGYSGVTLGLIHGTMPDAFILCHIPTRKEIPGYGVRLPGLRRWVDIYEGCIADIKKVPVIGIALNCFDLDEEEAVAAIESAAEETGLPVTDPIKSGVDMLMESIRKVVRKG